MEFNILIWFSDEKTTFNDFIRFKIESNNLEKIPATNRFQEHSKIVEENNITERDITKYKE